MKKPEHFERLLGVVMIIITVIFASVGALSYATFGIHTNIEVINNYPQDSKLVNTVQFLYSIAVLAGDPVQLFPALRILESHIFGHRSGKKNLTTKWVKNTFRTAIVLLLRRRFCLRSRESRSLRRADRLGCLRAARLHLPSVPALPG